jgi:hypothetical protein
VGRRFLEDPSDNQIWKNEQAPGHEDSQFIEVAEVAPPGLPCHPPPRPDLRHQQDEPAFQGASGLIATTSPAPELSRAQPSGVAALLHDYRRFAGGRLSLSLALMLLGALAVGFGLLMIVPLASIAIGRGDSAIFRLVPWAASLPIGQRFVAALALFLSAMAARSLLLFARDILLARLQAGYEANLRLRSAATLARARLAVREPDRPGGDAVPPSQ